MKELIYLDTDYIHSFISQIEGGLPTTIDLETTEEIAEDNELQKGHGFESELYATLKLGEIEIPFLFKSPSGEGTVGIKPLVNSSERISLSQLESGKEIISKKLHDDALKKFEEYLENHSLFNTNLNDVEQGDFIKVESCFQIVDFNYMKKALNSEKLGYFIFYEQKLLLENLKEANKQETNKEKKRIQTIEIRKLEEQFKNSKKDSENIFQLINNVLDYIQDIFPTDSFLFTDKLLIPLKQKYLRESSKELTFKYGSKSNSKITIVGKITRKVDNVEMPTFDGEYDFLEFGDIVNHLLNVLGILQEGNYIISPIAIYFE